jgi:predicted MFS family arabinose efflux permease
MDRHTIRARWAVAALFFINGFNMGSWAPQIPQMMERHMLRTGVMGVLILVIGLGAVVSMLFAGKLIAAYGSSRVLLTAAVCFLPIFPLMVLAPSPWIALPFLFLFGAFGGCMDVAVNANAITVERHMGRAIMSSSHGFWSLGGFIGGALGGAGHRGLWLWRAGPGGGCDQYAVCCRGVPVHHERSAA